MIVINTERKAAVSAVNWSSISASKDFLLSPIAFFAVMINITKMLIFINLIFYLQIYNNIEHLIFSLPKIFQFNKQGGIRVYKNSNNCNNSDD
jgi:hypothetical protein